MCRPAFTGLLLPTPTTRATRGSSICGMATWPTTISPTATPTTFGRCVADSEGE